MCYLSYAIYKPLTDHERCQICFASPAQSCFYWSPCRDLISKYTRLADHENITRSDMFVVFY